MIVKKETYTLVVLHGWGQSKLSWNVFMRFFNEDNIFCPDLPGFGTQPLANDDWGVREYSTWVEDWIKSKKLSNVIILGHSFGGRIGSYIASKNPTWLKGLILYGAPSLYRPSKTVSVVGYVSRLLKTFNLNLFTYPNSELEYADKHGLGKVFRKSVIFDQTTLLPHIQVPTLLIWGERDTEVPVSIAQEMHTLIPTSTLIILENLGHNAHIENPTLFYGTSKTFISNL
jgi:pimeloyl-ACP methyl ester carboxylesterase